MYIIYINDISNVVYAKIVKCVLFANDSALIISANCINELFQLANIYFTLFSKWLATNKLSLNDSKMHWGFR